MSKSIFKMIPGIYCIKNIVTNKVYIGSSETVSSRITSHKYTLKCNKHSNKYLQRSYNKHGILSFEYLILIYCEKDELLKYEDYYTNLFKSDLRKFGYNIEGFECGRKKHSLESKLKIGLANKGKKGPTPTPEMIEMIREIGKRPKSDSTKQKISISKIGVRRPKFSKEWLENMSKSGTTCFCDIYNLNGELIVSNVTIKYICTNYNISEQSVHNSIKNKYKCVGHYITLHDEDVSAYMARKRKVGNYKKIFLTKNEEVLEFKSLKECASFLNVNSSAVSQSLIKGCKVKGYETKYK